MSAPPSHSMNAWMPILHRAYLRAANGIRSNAVLYRWLFGHRPAPEVRGQLWDWTTIELARALRRTLRPGATLLDMGTGSTAVLAVYARLRLRCGRACGVDQMPELLRSASATAALCRVEVEFSLGSLFEGVTGRFDMITFNAPYIPVPMGQRLGVFRNVTDERRGGGGGTGLDTVERFLEEAPGHLLPGGIVLLGVNHFYVGKETVRAAIRHSGLVELDTFANRLTRACVYLLQPADPDRQATN